MLSQKPPLVRLAELKKLVFCFGLLSQKPPLVRLAELKKLGFAVSKTPTSPSCSQKVRGFALVFSLKNPRSSVLQSKSWGFCFGFQSQKPPFVRLAVKKLRFAVQKNPRSSVLQSMLSLGFHFGLLTVWFGILCPAYPTSVFLIE